MEMPMSPYTLGLWSFAAGIVAAYITGADWMAGAGAAAGVIAGGETSCRVALVRIAQAMAIGVGIAALAQNVESFPAQAVWTGALLWCAYNFGYDRGAVDAESAATTPGGPSHVLRRLSSKATTT
jgi:hypothetical protein